MSPLTLNEASLDVSRTMGYTRFHIMLMIRLSRIGRKKHPHYRLVIAEKARDTYGRALEILGHYHPLQKEDKDKLVLHKERIEHWLKEGAQMSNTVNNLLIEAGIVKADKKRTIGLYKSKKAVEETPEDQKKADESQAQKPAEEVKSETAAEAPSTEQKAETPAEEKPEEKKEDAPAKEAKEDTKE